MNVRVVSHTRQVVNAIHDGAHVGIVSVAAKVTAQAKSLSPFRSGEMKNGYGYEVKQLEGVVFNIVKHSVYQEFGTRNMEAKPSFRPAIAMITQGQTAAEAMAEAMQKTVRGVVA